MKVNVTKHCLEQIQKRKSRLGKESRALFFALDVFKEMYKTRKYKGTETQKKPGKDGKWVLFHKQTGYKWIYHYNFEMDEYTLVTFSIYTKLDYEVGKLLKILK